METHTPSKQLPKIVYLDTSGTAHELTNNPQLTILHLWATWCAPCIDELPILDSVAAAYKDKDVVVIAMSLDGKNTKKVTDFYTAHNIRSLPAYFDTKMQAYRALKVSGLPATIFIKNGREVARIDGPADWQSTDVKALLEKK